jgi:hypothetical protein
VPDRTWRVLRAHIGEETRMPIAAHRTIRSDTLWSCAQRVPWLIVRWAAT